MKSEKQMTVEGMEQNIESYETARAAAEAFAASMNFAFYILRGTRYEYRGHKSEEREATDEEMEMWTALGGPHGYLPY